MYPGGYAAGRSGIQGTIDGMFEIPGNFKYWNKLFGDSNFLVRFRIARNASGPFYHFEASEAPEFNILALFHRFYHGLQESVDDGFRFDFCYSGIGRDYFYDVCLGHFFWIWVEKITAHVVTETANYEYSKQKKGLKVPVICKKLKKV